MVRTCLRNKMQVSPRRWLVYVALATLPSLTGCSGRDRTLSDVCSPDGFCWQRPAPQGNNLHALSGLSSRYIWAVGDHGTILHFDGKRWTSSPSGTVADLHGVYSIGQRDAWAVGEDGTTLHHDGSAWHKVDSGVKDTLLATWGSSASDVYMVGRQGTLLHWDGKAIKKSDTLGETADLVGIYGFDSSDIWIVGHQRVIRHYNGSEWLLF